MKYLLLSFFLLPLATFAQSDTRLLEIQFQRVDSILQNILKENDELRVQMRELQRDNDSLRQQNEALDVKLNDLADELLKTSNIDISTLKSNQQKLFNDVAIFNWGSETRDCPNLGSHQQIKTVLNPDKTHTLRYLCFDGRVLHLGTEVHQPPE